MLRHTFLHISGIGEGTERKIWRSGIPDWPSFIRAHERGELRGRRVVAAIDGVRESLARYEQGDWRFFDGRLPAAAKWRAFGDLGDRALYVDIETTGGMGPEGITVIGAFDGSRTRSFVAGRDLDEARDFLDRYPLIVTYNGALFDLPILRARFRHSLLQHLHLDLRFPLHRLGLRGGLKKIEVRMGLTRSGATRGLDGWDAVRLWRDYREGSKEALDVLLQYNREDVEHLLPLAEYVFAELSRPALADLAARQPDPIGGEPASSRPAV